LEDAAHSITHQTQ